MIEIWKLEKMNSSDNKCLISSILFVTYIHHIFLLFNDSVHCELKKIKLVS